MDYSEGRPTEPPLAPGVEVVFCLRSYQPEHETERIVPTGRSHLVIELDDQPRRIIDPETRKTLQICAGSWVSGVHSRCFTISTGCPKFRLAVVQFAPGGAGLFLGRNMSGLNNRVVPGDDVFGSSVNELRECLCKIGEGAAVVAELETWLWERHCIEWSTGQEAATGFN